MQNYTKDKAIKKIFSRDYWVIKKSALFDEEYYLRTYPDVREADIDPVWHYCAYGWREGRNPSGRFDTGYYLSTYQDVCDAGVNPLVHYVRYGKMEGRRPLQNSEQINQKESYFARRKNTVKKILTLIRNNPRLVCKLTTELRRYGLNHAIRRVIMKLDTSTYSKSEVHIPEDDILDFSIGVIKTSGDKKNSLVDIVVPVYNGYEFFNECYQSILQHTDLTRNRLIIVNDCSTDRQLIDLLNDIEREKNSNIVVLSNSKNLGFIGSVNNGMKYGNNDVILLNSDTVVTSRWVDKILKCAYSKKNIGTVTALSNNATLCSVPNQWSDNELPNGFTIDSFACLIENISCETYPEIPSPVGFCMFIKRECIDKYGYFDEIYGKGYAEENDFGMRIYRNGYRHVVDDATFIYHKGSMTFGNNPEKQAKIEKNAKILYDRYPELKTLLQEFEINNTMLLIYRKLGLVLKAVNDPRKKVLLINAASLSNFPSGAFKHQIELINELSDSVLFLNLYSDDFSNIYLEIYAKDTIDKLFFGKYSWNKIDYSAEYPEVVLGVIISMFGVDIVHFQTPQHFPLSMFEIAKNNKCKTIFTAHDFLMYCQNFTLINQDGIFCGFNNDALTCSDCLNKSFYGKKIVSASDIVERKANIKKVFEFIDVFISPSESHARLLKTHLGIIDQFSLDVVPHPVRQLEQESKTDLRQKSIFNIAFIGNFTDIKGSKEFSEIVLKINSETIFWHIIGRVHDMDSYHKLKDLKNVVFTGQYQYDELSGILKRLDIDISLNLSRCHESYSYTLSECVSSGVLTIGNSGGAIGERILKNHAFGWIVESNDIVNNCIELIWEINSNKNLLVEKKALLLSHSESCSFDYYKKLYLDTAE